MTKIAILRTEKALPSNLDSIRDLLFGSFDGFTRDDKRAWRRFWKRLIGLEPGEFAQAELVFPRSGPFHRRHMKIEQSVFDNQDRFDDFEMFRDWLKIGAAWVVWVPGPKGGIVPLPRSISYVKADEEAFHRYHKAVIGFLRGPYAAKYLWPHLENPDVMMHTILEGFSE